MALNLGSMALFFGGLATAISCYSSQRMKVWGVLSVLMLWSLLLGYLKPFLPLADRFSPLGLLHYFRPGEVLQTGRLPSQDLMFLLLGAVVLWSVGERILAHRDL